MDDFKVDYPKVYVTATGMEMFYAAGDTYSKQRVMYATSPDGLTWTKRGALALEAARVVAVFPTGSSAELFYLCGGGVCLATRK